MTPEQIGLESRYRFNMDPTEYGGKLILVGLSGRDERIQPVVLANLIVEQDKHGWYSSIPGWYDTSRIGVVHVPDNKNALECASEWMRFVLDLNDQLPN